MQTRSIKLVFIVNVLSGGFIIRAHIFRVIAQIDLDKVISKL